MSFFSNWLDNLFHKKPAAPAPAVVAAPIPTPAPAPVAVAPAPAPASVSVPVAAAPPVQPAGFVLSESVTIPAAASAPRDPLKIGPTIAAALPETQFPNAAKAYDRIIRWFCNDPNMPAHPNLPDGPGGWAMAYDDVVVNGRDLSARDHEIWLAQRQRDALNNRWRTGVLAVPTSLPGPAEPNHPAVLDSLYLNVMGGRYMAITKRNIWQDMVSGNDWDIAAFINLGGSTYAGYMGTFDTNAYTGQFKAPVEDRLKAATA